MSASDHGRLAEPQSFRAAVQGYATPLNADPLGSYVRNRPVLIVISGALLALLSGASSAAEAPEAEGPDLIGIKIGEPFPDAPRSALIPLSGGWSITTLPGVASNKDGKVAGYSFTYECQDLAECALIAGILLERLEHQGYSLRRQLSPPANHRLEWQLQDPSLWLLLRVFRDDKKSPWLVGFQVSPQET